MDKNIVNKFLSCITAITTDGVLVVKNKTVTVSHSDGANIAMVRCQTMLDIPDGSYGVEYDKLLTAIKSTKCKDVGFEFTKSDYILTYETTRHNFAALNVATLQPIRPPVNIDWGCEIDIDVNEFIEIISVMEQNINSQKNELAKITVSYDGVLKFRAEEDIRNFVERDVSTIAIQKGAGGSFKSAYPMSIIASINTAIRKLNTKTVTICFDNDMPACLKLHDEDVTVEYIIAPRIE